MLRRNKVITLDKIKQGENFTINKFSDPNIKCLSTKFGVGEGQLLKCIYKSPGGPVILQRKFQEIAIGKSLTKNIEVQVV
ncbi:MAG: ferrous iron transport protein A [Cyanobacteriota bacterium]